MSCEICCATFNKTKHKEVGCPYCALRACRSCTQRYLLETNEDPHCMGCKAAWTRETMDTACTRTFVDVDYRKRRRDVLFERERAYFSEAQVEVEVIREINRGQVISDRARNDFHTVFRAHGLEYGRVTIGEMRDGYPEVYLAHETWMRAQRELERLRASRYSQKNLERARNFARRCPRESCEGFLDQEWACGLCETQFCRHCNEEIGESGEHECDPDVVKTVSLIESDSKPCVNCGVMIHRTEGCLQMWCPHCQTAFDWRTGEIVTGRIHNPHYLEHRRRHGTVGREHGDIPCGGAPTYDEIMDTALPFGMDEELRDKRRMILHYYYARLEIERELDWEWDPNDQRDEQARRHLRVWYLLGDYREDLFKNELYRREKQRARHREVRAILQTYVDTSADELRQYVLDPSRIDAACDNIRKITDIVNLAVIDVRRRYKCTKPGLIRHV